MPRRGSLALAGIASAMRLLMGSAFNQIHGEGSDASEGVSLSNTEVDLGKRKKLINNTDIPQHQIEAIARCILPDILAFYESEEGQREFAEWKKRREVKRREAENESIRKKTAYRKNGIRHFLFLQNLSFLPRPSWLGSWPAFHPITEIGAFVSVKENK